MRHASGLEHRKINIEWCGNVAWSVGGLVIFLIVNCNCLSVFFLSLCPCALPLESRNYGIRSKTTIPDKCQLSVTVTMSN